MKVSSEFAQDLGMLQSAKWSTRPRQIPAKVHVFLGFDLLGSRQSGFEPITRLKPTFSRKVLQLGTPGENKYFNLRLCLNKRI